MDSQMKEVSFQPSLTNERSNLSPDINNQCLVISSDEDEAISGIIADNAKEGDEDCGNAADDCDENHLVADGRTNKDSSDDPNEKQNYTNRDDIISSEDMTDSPTDESIHVADLESDKNEPIGDDLNGEETSVTVDRKTYENLVGEQKRLTDELKRLKERLITVEDDYTAEILELEDKESKVRNELLQALETIGHLKSCIKEVDQPSNWSERMEKLKAERDNALDDVSKLDDKVHRLTASVTNLQLVIEQLQKENEKKLSSLTKKHQATLEAERAIQNDLRLEVEMYQKKSIEAAQALQAATRLTENIDKKEEIIQNLKQELCDKEKQISNLESEKANLKASFEGKVDKQVIKNLILGYFGTPNDKKHEVERLLARVLDFNEQEMMRAGLSFGRSSNKFGPNILSSSTFSSSNVNPSLNSSNAVGSILLAPLQSNQSTGINPLGGVSQSTSSLSSASSSTSLYSEPNAGSGSLSKMFVEFLEAESRPKAGSTSNQSTSSLTRELARDLTKVALTSNNKSHLFLEPTLTGTVPVPISTSSSLSHQSPSVTLNQKQSTVGNQSVPMSNGKPVSNPLLASASPSYSPLNKLSPSPVSNLYSNPIRPIMINSLSNKTESDLPVIPIVRSNPAHYQIQQQHEKSSSLSSNTSSSSSLILSNPMPSFTTAIKPITLNDNSQPSLSSFPLATGTAATETISPSSSSQSAPLSQLISSRNSSLNLLSMSDHTSKQQLTSSSIATTSFLPPTSSSNSISSMVSSYSHPTSSSDYNSIITNSHLNVTK